MQKTLIIFHDQQEKIVIDIKSTFQDSLFIGKDGRSQAGWIYVVFTVILCCASFCFLLEHIKEHFQKKLFQDLKNGIHHAILETFGGIKDNGGFYLKPFLVFWVLLSRPVATMRQMRQLPHLKFPKKICLRWKIHNIFFTIYKSD